MNDTVDKIYRIHTPDEWEAMNSPIRIEIVAIMEMLGTASIAEIARHMGRKPDSLYHHLRKLQDVGLVLTEGYRKVGRQTEALFRLRAKTLLVGFDQESQADRDRFAKLAATLLRMAQREFISSLQRSEDLRFEGDQKNVWIRREAVRLSPAALQQLNYHLNSIVDILDDARHDTESPPHNVTLLLNPLVTRQVTKPASTSEPLEAGQ